MIHTLVQSTTTALEHDRALNIHHIFLYYGKGNTAHRDFILCRFKLLALRNLAYGHRKIIIVCAYLETETCYFYVSNTQQICDISYNSPLLRTP